MRILDLPNLPPLSEAKHILARSLVELAWNDGAVAQTFEIEYEGAGWEVVVRPKQTEDAPLESDFIEELPE
jgi:hypothetical protein